MKKIDSIFYIALIISFIVLLLPAQYKAAIYSLNYLGWFWLLICLPTTAVTFIWSGIQDLKSENWRRLSIRGVVFVSVLVISIGFWFYRAHELGTFKEY